MSAPASSPISRFSAGKKSGRTGARKAHHPTSVAKNHHHAAAAANAAAAAAYGSYPMQQAFMGGKRFHSATTFTSPQQPD